LPEERKSCTPALDPEQQLLSGRMIVYWASFAANGDPNTVGLPHWPAYQGDGRVLSLAAGPAAVAVADFGRAHQCAFWRSIH
jgi:para-nitrobenzyl esterase